jgi:hypothetical protein
MTEDPAEAEEIREQMLAQNGVIEVRIQDEPGWEKV